MMKKSRSQLLEEFTKHLFERDPLGYCSPDDPNREREYESEALSILSRFVEGLIIRMPEQDAYEHAYHTIQSTFMFWFNQQLEGEQGATLARELLDIFRSAYPEQDVEHGVVSADEERSGDGRSGVLGIAPGETPP